MKKTKFCSPAEQAALMLAGEDQDSWLVAADMLEEDGRLKEAVAARRQHEYAPAVAAAIEDRLDAFRRAHQDWTRWRLGRQSFYLLGAKVRFQISGGPSRLRVEVWLNPKWVKVSEKISMLARVSLDHVAANMKGARYIAPRVAPLIREIPEKMFGK